MKMYCISDNIDTAVGLKLAGIESIVLQDKSEIEHEIDAVIKNPNIGILIVTEKIEETAFEKVKYIKDNLKLPLLIKI